jgi:small conductance mechanosensitive channel
MPELDPQLLDRILVYAMNVLAAIVTLAIGWLAARWLGNTVRDRVGKAGRLDPTLGVILGKATRGVVLLLTLTAVLNQFGVQTASLIALIGAAGLAIGLALQGALSNVASGIMLLAMRPFKIGDYVDFGTGGTVDEIGLFVTTMHTPDNIAMVVPNSKIWGNVIKNYSMNDTRRIDMVFGIGYGDDMDKAIRIIEEIIAAEPRFLKDPAPLVKVAELADSSVNIYARPWVNRADFFAAKLDFTKAVKERFSAEGVSIPFPQRDVHLVEERRTAALAA